MYVSSVLPSGVNLLQLFSDSLAKLRYVVDECEIDLNRKVSRCFLHRCKPN